MRSSRAAGFGVLEQPGKPQSEDMGLPLAVGDITAVKTFGVATTVFSIANHNAW